MAFYCNFCKTNTHNNGSCPHQVKTEEIMCPNCKGHTCAVVSELSSIDPIQEDGDGRWLGTVTNKRYCLDEAKVVVI